MVSPFFEKFVIVIGGLLVIAGLVYLVMTFPTSGIGFIIAAVAGTAGVAALVTYFTRNPA